MSLNKLNSSFFSVSPAALDLIENKDPYKQALEIPDNMSFGGRRN